MKTSVIYRHPQKRKHFALHAVIALLLLLWVPVAIDKVLGFSAFKNGILNQPFGDRLGYFLIYSLPALELVTVSALVFERFRKAGLILSVILMAGFTGYIGIALLGAWEKLPCGCGSVISGMSWTQHFFFNLFFLALSIFGLYLWYKQRGKGAESEIAKGGSAKRRIKNNIY